jgi:hypothetical protein
MKMVILSTTNSQNNHQSKLPRNLWWFELIKVSHIDKKQFGQMRFFSIARDRYGAKTCCLTRENWETVSSRVSSKGGSQLFRRYICDRILSCDILLTVNQRNAKVKG